jgi:hypothetical protein
MLKRCCMTCLLLGALVCHPAQADEPEPTVTVAMLREGGLPRRTDRTIARRIGTLGQFLRASDSRNEPGKGLSALVPEDVQRLLTLLDKAEVWVVFEAPDAGDNDDTYFRKVPTIEVQVRNLAEASDDVVFESVVSEPWTVTMNDESVRIHFFTSLKLKSGVLRFPTNPADNIKLSATGWNFGHEIKLRPEKPGLYDDRVPPTTKPATLPSE